jgi:hypothetical protein
MWYLYLDESGDLGFDFAPKIKMSVPYRGLAPRL